MIKFDAWQFPDDEKHLPDWMMKVNRRVDGRLTYQYGKYEEALKLVKNRRLAVDVGSHIGLWAWFMARDFENIACFEPMVEHQACWFANMKDRKNADIYFSALGAEDGKIALETRTHGSSGDTQVIVGKAGEIPMTTLDKFKFENVDFIKIDCEGYELNVLKGAAETIKSCKPVVVVEQKGTMSLKYDDKKLGAVDFLKSLGAKVRHEISGDYIMSWDE
jgi:FkbM family methyltransferase